MIRICQTPNKSIEIDNSKHDSIGFATKITSISHQPPAGSANAQFDKTQFFLDTLYGKLVDHKRALRRSVRLSLHMRPTVLAKI